MTFVGCFLYKTLGKVIFLYPNYEFYIAITLDVLGVAALGFGIYQQTQKTLAQCAMLAMLWEAHCLLQE